MKMREVNITLEYDQIDEIVLHELTETYKMNKSIIEAIESKNKPYSEVDRHNLKDAKKISKSLKRVINYFATLDTLAAMDFEF